MKRAMLAVVLGAVVAVRSASGGCPSWPDWAPSGQPTAEAYLDEMARIAEAQDLADACTGDCAGAWLSVGTIQALCRGHGTECCHATFDTCEKYYGRVKAAWQHATRNRVTVTNLSSGPGAAATSNFLRTDGGNFGSGGDGFAAGMGVVVAGFPSAAYNRAWYVTAVTASTLTVADPTQIIRSVAAAQVQKVSFVPVGVVEFDQVEAIPGSAGSNEAKFKRAAGGFDAVGWAQDLTLRIDGFTGAAAVNNGVWKIKSVTSTEIVVVDTGNVVQAAGAAAAQKAIYDRPLACFETLDHVD